MEFKVGNHKIFRKQEEFTAYYVCEKCDIYAKTQPRIKKKAKAVPCEADTTDMFEKMGY